MVGSPILGLELSVGLGGVCIACSSLKGGKPDFGIGTGSDSASATNTRLKGGKPDFGIGTCYFLCHSQPGNPMSEWWGARFWDWNDAFLFVESLCCFRLNGGEPDFGIGTVQRNGPA